MMELTFSNHSIQCAIDHHDDVLVSVKDAPRPRTELDFLVNVHSNPVNAIAKSIKLPRRDVGSQPKS
jgi:hypothetical protein